jgi:hypothetical protein
VEQRGLPLDLLGLAEQLDEDGDLRAQDVGLDRLEDVIDRAERVAARDVALAGRVGGEEDDRDVARLLAPADEGGRLEAVDAGHVHVQEDDGHVAFEQVAQRLVAGGGLDEVPVRRLEDGVERDQVRRVVIDDQDVDFVGRLSLHDPPPNPPGTAR